MKVFSTKQIKEWDKYTIQHEPISSLSLMERAAAACVNWIGENLKESARFLIFCGPGNNGGDGLAIGRMLAEKGKKVHLYILDATGSPDFNANLERAESAKLSVTHIRNSADFPDSKKEDVMIDALFGTGLNRAVTGLAAELISHLNKAGQKTIAIDIPSGMFADQSSKDNLIVRSDFTLSFQIPKLAFFMADQSDTVGHWFLLNIGVHPGFYTSAPTPLEFTDAQDIAKIIKPRHPFAHKGTYGHAALLAGSYGMMGAAILAARACLRSGAGKLTCHIPKSANTIMQIAVPEAILQIDEDELKISGFKPKSDYQGIGVGPGIGQSPQHRELLRDLFANRKPLVIDADGLNMLASHQELVHEIPPQSILTPHPKEMERLFGASMSDFARMELALQKAAALDVIIVLKGHFSFIAFPDGKGIFNSTGNAGMAKAGSGDVLTGLLTGLVARGYSTHESAILGVYLHGLAGDLARNEIGVEALQASDIINYLPKAFLSLSETTISR
jgi:hydroxyethylthiazole kinase-like uncharacterized protein yjeF